MPTYDCKCKKCGKEFEGVAVIAKRDDIKCECGGKTKRLISPLKNSFDPFVPYVLENGVPEPVMITSREQRNAIFKEKGIDQVPYRRGKYSQYSRIFPVSGKCSAGAGTRWTGEGMVY